MKHFQFSLQHTRSMGSQWWDGAAMRDGHRVTVREWGPPSVLLPPVSPWAALSWPSPHAVQRKSHPSGGQWGWGATLTRRTSALFLVVPKEKAPRPALPWNLAREPRTPELIHPAGLGGCFCARCPLCEAGVTFAPQTGFSRLPAACTDLHPPPWLSPHCALPAPLLQMAPALTLDFFPFQFLNERTHQTLWYSEWEEAQSGVKVVQALVPASPRKSLPPASLCSYGATAGVLLAKAAPAGYPAMLAAAPNPSPEDVTRALAYKNP